MKVRSHRWRRTEALSFPDLTVGLSGGAPQLIPKALFILTAMRHRGSSRLTRQSLVRQLSQAHSFTRAFAQRAMVLTDAATRQVDIHHYMILIKGLHET